MKKIYYIYTSIIILLLISSNLSLSEEINKQNHTISINTNDNKLLVTENLILKGNSNDTYDIINIWIMNEAEEIDVLFGGSPLIPITSGDNFYELNVSSFDIEKNSTIQLIISYTLDIKIERFEKLITYNTEELTIDFDENNLFTGEDITKENHFSLILYKPTEVPLSGYIIVFILLLLVLLIVTVIYAFRRQRISKNKEITGESEDLLKVKKDLLMSLLKDLEKQHRAKKIHDDTYHKLKDHYKQQTVETMKKIEDIELEIK